MWPPKTPVHSDRHSVYAVNTSDPRGELIDRSAVSEQDMEEISALMQALGRLRDAERQLSKASQRYMKLNETDMRALHYLIVSENRGLVVTPSAITHHLGISAASTTKLLDRLEDGGHIMREIHPSDRRAFRIRITPETREAAMNSVGRQQARRFQAAAALTSDERQVVIRFLERMTDDLLAGTADIPEEPRAAVVPAPEPA